MVSRRGEGEALCRFSRLSGGVQEEEEEVVVVVVAEEEEEEVEDEQLQVVASLQQHLH